MQIRKESKANREGIMPNRKGKTQIRKGIMPFLSGIMPFSRQKRIIPERIGLFFL